MQGGRRLRARSRSAHATFEGLAPSLGTHAVPWVGTQWCVHLKRLERTGRGMKLRVWASWLLAPSVPRLMLVPAHGFAAFQHDPGWALGLHAALLHRTRTARFLSEQRPASSLRPALTAPRLRNRAYHAQTERRLRVCCLQLPPTCPPLVCFRGRPHTHLHSLLHTLATSGSAGPLPRPNPLRQSLPSHSTSIHRLVSRCEAAWLPKRSQVGALRSNGNGQHRRRPGALRPRAVKPASMVESVLLPPTSSMWAPAQHMRSIPPAVNVQPARPAAGAARSSGPCKAMPTPGPCSRVTRSRTRREAGDACGAGPSTSGARPLPARSTSPCPRPED